MALQANYPDLFGKKALPQLSKRQKKKRPKNPLKPKKKRKMSYG